MTQRTITCRYCENGQQVLYDPDAAVKTLNLDGTKHFHYKQSQSQQQRTVTTESIPHPTSYEADKQADIKQAHQENMDASERLRQSIDNLAAKLDRIVDAFLDSKG